MSAPTDATVFQILGLGAASCVGAESEMAKGRNDALTASEAGADAGDNSSMTTWVRSRAL